jgi:hypothetical protein
MDGLQCGRPRVIFSPEFLYLFLQKGFNPQFAWSFDRLISLYYMWSFSSATDVTPPPPVDATDAASLAQAGEIFVLIPLSSIDALLLHRRLLFFFPLQSTP